MLVLEFSAVAVHMLIYHVKLSLGESFLSFMSVRLSVLVQLFELGYNMAQPIPAAADPIAHQTISYFVEHNYVEIDR